MMKRSNKISPLFLSLIIELLCKLNTLIEVESIFLLKKIKNCFKK